MPTPLAVVRIVGTVALLCAVFGLWYNGHTLRSVSRGIEGVNEPPPLRRWFYTLSTLCVLFHIALASLGIALVIGYSALWLPFTGLMVIEVVFVLVIGALWLHPRHGMSVGAASGVSAGGLVPQFIVLLPVWAPIVLWYAHRELSTP